MGKVRCNRYKLCEKVCKHKKEHEEDGNCTKYNTCPWFTVVSKEEVAYGIEEDICTGLLIHL